jgi:ketosteroid isomerase-like protein
MSVTDHVAIESLRTGFTDAALHRDYDRMAALFTDDGVWGIPAADVRFTSRTAIREGTERLGALWEFLLQFNHPGPIVLTGDTATGRTYVREVGRFRDGTSHTNYGIYHDRYARTEAGWRFTERTYEALYSDDTPLTGTYKPTDRVV